MKTISHKKNDIPRKHWRLQDKSVFGGKVYRKSVKNPMHYLQDKHSLYGGVEQQIRPSLGLCLNYRRRG